MNGALTVAFYTSALGGLVTWIVAIRAAAPIARWLYLVAAALLAVAGVLGMFSIGIIFLVLAVVCLVASVREMRRPSGDDRAPPDAAPPR